MEHTNTNQKKTSFRKGGGGGADDGDVIDDRIAVVGVSAILPGGENLFESWESIRAGIDSVQDLPSDRLDVTAYYNPEKTAKDQIYCKRGGFIPDFEFDPREFGMNMHQMEDSDTNQTLTLLKVKEALQDAGIEAFSKERRNIGCVLGIGGGQKSSHEFYSRLNYVVMEKVLRKMGMPEEDIQAAVEKYKANFPEWRLDSFPGFLGNVTAGRCTNAFNLEGMNCVVDAACASSLVSLKVCIDELLYGDCDTMVCGATCTDNSIGMYMAFSKTPVFSTKQQVTAYDEDTKGMLIGEGSVMLVLKRLADAQKAGDEIHAVVRGCASSSDGKAPGIYVPTISGQEQCIRRAWAKAGLDPKSATLVEGHGTGTPVGDKIELTALRNVFEANGAPKGHLAVGSVKSQIGHLKAVAGCAGLVKVIMALKHKTLPLSINVHRPPPLQDGTPIQDTCLYINTKNRPWFVEPGMTRRAGVSSFGFGGANYHCVLEEYEPEHTDGHAYRMNSVPQGLIISAPTVQALTDLVSKEAQNIREILAERADRSESQRRKHLAYLMQELAQKYSIRGDVPSSHARVGFLATDAQQCADALDAIASKLSKDAPNVAPFALPKSGNAQFRPKAMETTGKVAALFAGQGSQYVNMFDEVAMNWPEYRRAVTAMDEASKSICGERISAIMYPRQPYDEEAPLDDKQISTVRNAQMATVAASIGLYEIFTSAGFKPDFTAGHSLGEYSALYASGAIDKADLMKVVCHRADAMQNIATNGTGGSGGAMAAVIGENAHNVHPEADNVWIANINSPTQTVITGSVEGVKQDSERLSKAGYKVIQLKTGDAFHSPKMASAESSFNQELKSTKFKALAETSPRAYANVTGSAYPTGSADEIRKILSTQMTSSVKFMNEIKAMYRDGARVFVEFGPKNVLSRLVGQILADQEEEYITLSVNPTVSRNPDEQLREAAVHAAVAGIPLNNFDPWQVNNPFVSTPYKKKSRTTLTLSAATYVSKKTRKEQEQIMEDGKTFSCYSGNGKTPAVAPPPSSSKSVADQYPEKQQLEKELRQARADAEQAKQEKDKLKQKLSEAEAKAKAAKTPQAQPSQQTPPDSRQQAILALLEETKRTQAKLAELLESPLEEKHGDLASSSKTHTFAKTIPAPSKQQVTPSVDTNQAESIVLEVLAAKTGYDVDMIEGDMELETELGIDSIKRVEILSDVQARLQVEAKDVDALSRTRTVSEVIDAMKKEMGASAGAPTSTPAPASTAQSSVPAQSSASTANASSVDTNQAENIVLEVLAAKTGYDVDMIEGDMELETELGIDSIKRVEILSDVQARLQVEAKDVDALSRTRTVSEVIDAMKKEMGASAGAPAPAPAQSNASTANASSVDTNQAESIVLEVLAAKTGYDVDMIEGDMELETELGIDSIKRVEILSDVQARLQVEAKDVDALSRTRTVSEVIDAMKKEMGASAGAPAPAPGSTAQSSVPAQTANASSVDTNQAENIVLEVLAAKTGYDVDMIEGDMELETELGIDSIKRVEILSDVQARLQVEAKDVDALSRTRTVSEVIDAMKKEMGASAGAPTSAPAPTSTAQSSVPAQSSASTANASSVDTNQAENIVLEVLAAKTGYDVDMIEGDMELETELGIDSIKRVEILSDVQARLQVEAKDVDALSRTRTVSEVIDAMKKEMSNGAGASDRGDDSAFPASRDRSSTPTSGSSESLNSSVEAASPNAENEAERIVMEVLASKTGYDVDMIEFDMELETELGIDSIKRVEILSDVQAQLEIEAKDVDALSRTRTVGEVIEAMKKELASGSANGSLRHSSAATTKSSKSSGKQQAKPVNLRGAGCENLDLTYASVVEIPTPDVLVFKTPENRPVLIMDDGQGVSEHLARKFGNSAVLITFPGGTPKTPNVVHVPDLSEDSIRTMLQQVTERHGTPSSFIFSLSRLITKLEDQHRWAMLVAKHLKPSLTTPIDEGRTSFLSVTRMNGKLGFGNASVNENGSDVVHAAERGAIFGLSKSLDLEWPDVYCRAIDIAEDINAETAATYIAQEYVCPDRSLREVGYTSDGKRYTTTALSLSENPYPEHLDRDGGDEAAPPSADDCFLVSGGARGITPVCVREIAAQLQGGTFVLLGRSKAVAEPEWAKGIETEEQLKKAAMSHMKAQHAAGKAAKPTPRQLNSEVNSVIGAREVNASVDGINAAGGKAVYVACDVTSSSKVRDALKEAGVNNVSGIIHASGVLRDKLIENKKGEEFDAVYGTKVGGLRSLLTALDALEHPEKLRHAIMFSSLAGYFGNRGQSDYAMANEVLNKVVLELKRRAPKCAARAFDFGPWSAGMVTPALKAHFESLGVQVIDRDGGAKTVANVACFTSQSQCLFGNWGNVPVKPSATNQSIVRTLSVKANPFLKDHVLKGKSVLPMTVATSYLASCVAKAYPGYCLWGLADSQLFRGVTIEPGQSEVVLQVNFHEENSGEKDKVHVLATMLHQHGEKMVPAYQTKVILGTKSRTATGTGGLQMPSDLLQVDTSAVEAKSIDKEALYDGTTLFHGPLFQSIQTITKLGSEGIQAKCTHLPLNDSERGQFSDLSCDGFAADIGFQLMLVWARQLENAGALPSFIKNIDFYSAIPKGAEFWATIKRDGDLAKGAFKIRKGRFYLHDDQDNVFMSGQLSVTVDDKLSYR